MIGLHEPSRAVSLLELLASSSVNSIIDRYYLLVSESNIKQRLQGEGRMPKQHCFCGEGRGGGLGGDRRGRN